MLGRGTDEAGGGVGRGMPIGRGGFNGRGTEGRSPLGACCGSGGGPRRGGGGGRRAGNGGGPDPLGDPLGGPLGDPLADPAADPGVDPGEAPEGLTPPGFSGFSPLIA